MLSKTKLKISKCLLKLKNIREQTDSCSRNILYPLTLTNILNIFKYYINENENNFININYQFKNVITIFELSIFFINFLTNERLLKIYDKNKIIYMKFRINYSFIKSIYDKCLELLKNKRLINNQVIKKLYYLLFNNRCVLNLNIVSEDVFEKIHKNTILSQINLYTDELKFYIHFKKERFPLNRSAYFHVCGFLDFPESVSRIYLQ